MKILKFYTDTCMTCKVVGRVLEKMGLEVENINALEDTSMVDKYEICTTPTLIFLDETGEEVDRLAGSVSESNIRSIVDRVK